MKFIPIDFRQIVPHLGSPEAAFEEFCCQNARHSVPEPNEGEFVRYRGDGGDGGVECVWRFPGGDEWGWQVKYVFDLASALTKLSASLDTAMRTHPHLSRFTVCLPFNLTGPTGRKTRTGGPVSNQHDQFNRWRAEQIDKARLAGRELAIFVETPSTLLDALQSYDPDGGRFAFWFDSTHFTGNWFVRHLDEAKHQAGPRYTPELSIEVPVARALEGLALTEHWFSDLSRRSTVLRKLAREWERGIAETKFSGWDTEFPEDLRSRGEATARSLTKVIEGLEVLVTARRVPVPLGLTDALLNETLPALRELRVLLAHRIDDQYGKGASESASFRQHQSEYEVSFPAANVDRAKKLIEHLEELSTMLGSPASSVAGKSEAVLIGEAGSGKTHAICDAAMHRQARGLRTVVMFGERFSGTVEPWTQIIQQLGLRGDMARDMLLAALDAAGEATGYPLLICIDGLNETIPRTYWQSHLTSIAAHVRRYPFIKLLVSCRTAYLSHVLPEASQQWYRIEHTGFKGMQFNACRAFFAYYGLDMAMPPVLQTEFSNPLFLKLICRAACERGYKNVPTGWHGIYTAVTALLETLNHRFSRHYGVSDLHRIPEKGLRLFIAAMRANRRNALTFADAAKIIQSAVPQGVLCAPLIDWLLGESLLIADVQPDETAGGITDHVHIAFDRLGDHLLASTYLEEISPENVVQAFGHDQALAFTMETIEAVQENMGLLEALSVQIPERFGVELFECAALVNEYDDVAGELLRATLRSFQWRDTQHISYATVAIVKLSLSTPGMAPDVFDALLGIASKPSALDALFMHSMLSIKPMPDRDAFWCPYLYRSFEEKRPAWQLIQAGLEMNIEHVDVETIERWAIALIWFCAANDRRVRDHSTKALVRITSRQPSIWVRLLTRFCSCDDEYVVERCLLCAYGALLRSRDTAAERDVAQAAFDMVFRNLRRFQNAAIRDHARLILELAKNDGVLDAGIAENDFLPPYTSDWPLTLPSDEELHPFVEDQKSFPKLYSSCTFDDFFTYGLYRVHQYDHVLTRREMGRWIFKHVLDMGYTGKQFAGFDGFFLYKYGGGRGKPAWAERIGKKYQWIALARLAARLSDNNEPKEDDWEPAAPAVPLVFVTGRDIDPSLLVKGDLPDTKEAWWMPIQYDYPDTPIDESEWLKDATDIPKSQSLLSVTDPSGRSWLTLDAYFDWREEVSEDADEEFSWNDHRDIWMHIHSYLVREDDFEMCFKWARKQDFFGAWMPEGSKLHAGFVGEYPWATPFQFADEWCSVDEFRGVKAPACQLYPTCNSLSTDDEYDAFQINGRTVHLPASPFFQGGGLRWDGCGGFTDETGNPRVLDPSFTDPGPSALLIDPEFLADYLASNKLRIIWTVSAQKLVSTERPLPRLRISQVHTLSHTGLISSRPVVIQD